MDRSGKSIGRSAGRSVGSLDLTTPPNAKPLVNCSITPADVTPDSLRNEVGQSGAVSCQLLARPI